MKPRDVKVQSFIDYQDLNPSSVHRFLGSALQRIELRARVSTMQEDHSFQIAKLAYADLYGNSRAPLSTPNPFIRLSQLGSYGDDSPKLVHLPSNAQI